MGFMNTNICKEIEQQNNPRIATKQVFAHKLTSYGSPLEISHLQYFKVDLVFLSEKIT